MKLKSSVQNQMNLSDKYSFEIFYLKHSCIVRILQICLFKHIAFTNINEMGLYIYIYV